jgi:hypothetical protein
MKAKITAIAIIFFFLSLSSVWLVFAQENTPIEKDGTADTEDAVACDVLEDEFDQKIEKFLLSEPTHTYKYQVLWLKTSAIARKAEIMGYDTQDLEESLDELDELTSQFSNYFDRFMQQMVTTRRYLCLENEQLYANALKTAKDRLEDVRKTARDINYLYTEEIRENILALQEQAEVMEVTDNE